MESMYNCKINIKLICYLSKAKLYVNTALQNLED